MSLKDRLKINPCVAKFDWDSIMPKARELYALGMQFVDIARKFDVTDSALRYHFNPRPTVPRYREEKEKELRDLKAKIPEDTRTPCQILMGEPTFERSALYQKQKAEAGA